MAAFSRAGLQLDYLDPLMLKLLFRRHKYRKHLNNEKIF